MVEPVPLRVADGADVHAEPLLAAAANIAGRMGAISAIAASLVLAASLRVRIPDSSPGISSKIQQSTATLTPALTTATTIVTSSRNDDQHQEDDHDNGNHGQNFSHFSF